MSLKELFKTKKDSLVCAYCGETIAKCDSCGKEMIHKNYIFCKQSQHYCNDCVIKTTAITQELTKKQKFILDLLDLQREYGFEATYEDGEWDKKSKDFNFYAYNSLYNTLDFMFTKKEFKMILDRMDSLEELNI